MSYFPDMGKQTLGAEGDHVRAVGWLHPDQPYPKGAVSAEFVDRLESFVEQCEASGDALYFGASGGVHTCEFCGKALGASKFGVPCGNLLFVAPDLILHYIQQHGYRPPAEFVTAVLHSPLPESEDYQSMTEPFWHIHKSLVRRDCEDF